MTSSSKPKRQVGTKIQHGKPSLNPRYRSGSPEELERLGVPTGSALIISPTPRGGSKTSRKDYP
jgi:hypothetical protein